MTFPVIKYKYNDVDDAKILAELVDQKMKSLEKFIHDGESVACEVEFSKVAPHNNGQIHQVTANLTVNGNAYRAEATEESFEKAVDEVRSELDKEMRRAKEKQVTLDKNAGREAKERMLEDNQ
ncbi:MAG: HPF/RaiA family ribosome-associated protein [Candidatus Pacebacteria bacterium]|nr:HPF/RaiA family ribosome-associated protein [Candidatus Paceibacterota bacterium]